MMKAVILLSGGIDSATALAIARSEGYELYALSFDYEQRHRNELSSARRIAEAFSVKQHLVVHSDLRVIGGSALTSDIEVPKRMDPPRNCSPSCGTGSPDGEQRNTIPVTYVPARNTIFLSFALGWAEVNGADDIFIGANAVDYSGYPDCRPEFLHAFETMANLATRASVEGTRRFRVNAPLLHMTKAEIVRKGMELGVDHSLTWSCYDPQTDPGTLSLVPCEKCDSCILRAKGFREAGIADPLIVRLRNV